LERGEGPKAPAIHGGVNPAGIGRLAGKTKVARRIPVVEVGGSVETANGEAGNGGELGGTLRRFCESRLQDLLFPLLLGCRWLPGGLCVDDRSSRGRRDTRFRQFLAHDRLLARQAHAMRREQSAQLLF